MSLRERALAEFEKMERQRKDARISALTTWLRNRFDLHVKPQTDTVEVDNIRFSLNENDATGYSLFAELLCPECGACDERKPAPDMVALGRMIVRDAGLWHGRDCSCGPKTFEEHRERMYMAREH